MKGKSNTFLTKILVGIVIFLMGVFCCFAYFKFIDVNESKETDTTSERVKESNEKNSVKSNSDSKNNEDGVSNDKVNTNGSSTSVDENTKQLHTEEFTNQNGEKVKITAEKIVGATGYAGSSNDKFFLKNGNLYYMNISSDKTEMLLATSVKDLYLEQDDVCAELNSDGKVINQEIRVKYK